LNTGREKSSNVIMKLQRDRERNIAKRSKMNRNKNTHNYKTKIKAMRWKNKANKK
jgi:hypothetical protein